MTTKVRIKRNPALKSRIDSPGANAGYNYVVAAANTLGMGAFGFIALTDPEPVSKAFAGTITALMFGKAAVSLHDARESLGKAQKLQRVVDRLEGKNNPVMTKLRKAYSASLRKADAGGAYLTKTAEKRAASTTRTATRPAAARSTGGGYKNGRGFANRAVQAKAQAARSRKR